MENYKITRVFPNISNDMQIIIYAKNIKNIEALYEYIGEQLHYDGAITNLDALDEVLHDRTISRITIHDINSLMEALDGGARKKYLHSQKYLSPGQKHLLDALEKEVGKSYFDEFMEILASLSGVEVIFSNP